MANVNSTDTGVGLQGLSINDNRRMFNFGERIAELAPQQSPFFVYLSKVAKKVTDDPVFKFLEQRHQWQRRNFAIETAITGSGSVHEALTVSSGAFTNNGQDIELDVDCGYDKYGVIKAGQPCNFILPNQVLAISTATSGGDVKRIKLKPGVTITHHAAKTTIKLYDHATTTWYAEPIGSWGASTTFDADSKGQIIGSAFAEGGNAPDGWEDAMFDREGYCQIFKTSCNLFTGTAMATRYRGIGNEFQRCWTEKLMEHKMDLEHAFLFGIGSAHAVTADNAEGAGAPMRYTHGILPYTESNGKIYNFSYASSGYDAFLDAMEDFFAPESGNTGNKLVLASRKVITYLNKLGSGSFLNNSVGSSQYSLDVQNIKGAFGHQVTMVNTIFGNLHFIADPLMRGPYEDYCVAVDMANVAYRPLAGNGISRDTYIETNVQGNDVDGRKDQIITEAGLEISLPETHAVMKWS